MGNMQENIRIYAIIQPAILIMVHAEQNFSVCWMPLERIQN